MSVGANSPLVTKITIWIRKSLHIVFQNRTTIDSVEKKISKWINIIYYYYYYLAFWISWGYFPKLSKRNTEKRKKPRQSTETHWNYTKYFETSFTLWDIVVFAHGMKNDCCIWATYTDIIMRKLYNIIKFLKWKLYPKCYFWIQISFTNERPMTSPQFPSIS